MSNISKKNNYRFAILGSTNGSIVPSLISGIKQISLDLNLDLEIPVIISNKPKAGILDKADLFNIKKEIVISDSNLKREDYDKKLDIILQNNKVDFILLSGNFSSSLDKNVSSFGSEDLKSTQNSLG